MAKAEMFPDIDGQEPDTLRVPIDANRAAAIEEAFLSGYHLDAIVEYFGWRETAAVLTNPDLVKQSDSTSNLMETSGAA